jgi:hypothetical protein
VRELRHVVSETLIAVKLFCGHSEPPPATEILP